MDSSRVMQRGGVTGLPTLIPSSSGSYSSRGRRSDFGRKQSHDLSFFFFETVRIEGNA